MILLVTANDVLAQGLTALLNAIANLPGVTVANNDETALLVMAEGDVGLVILDGSIPCPSLTCLLAARAAAVNFPPILLLMDSADHVELARREQLISVLKGSPIVELIFTIESLLPPLENLPQMDESSGRSDT
jgi:DNA-binding NarL/FixJ family response regulator